MTTAAFIGSQTLMQVGDGLSPEGFITIGEVVSVSPIAQKKDLVEVTHLLSQAKEFIGGLSDGQEVTIVCNMIPNNIQQTLLWTAAGTPSAAKNFKYVLPSTAAGGTKTSSFAAIVLSSSAGPTTPNTATQVTFGLKISGPISAWT